jgi:hypothetical protein
MNQENGFMFAPAPFRHPAFLSLGQTAPAVPPPPVVVVSPGVELAPIVFAAGTILLVTELAGVTHVVPWLKKVVGLGKGKK